MIIKKQKAAKFSQPSIAGRKYDSDQIPENSFVYGELDGEHGQRTSSDEPRLYYVVKGSGSVEIAGKKSEISEGDLVIIPPNTTYNYWSKDGKMEFILYMERH
jgi:mannose-6-phosphate isomerase-like protein (cupin superfamily)